MEDSSSCHPEASHGNKHNNKATSPAPVKRPRFGNRFSKGDVDAHSPALLNTASSDAKRLSPQPTNSNAAPSPQKLLVTTQHTIAPRQHDTAPRQHAMSIDTTLRRQPGPSIKPRTRRPAPSFALKLEHLVRERPDLIDLQHGALTIKHPKNLEAVLGQYFRTRTYQSFQRQLNNFGFTKDKLASSSKGPETVYVKRKGVQIQSVADLSKIRSVRSHAEPRERSTRKTGRHLWLKKAPPFAPSKDAPLPTPIPESSSEDELRSAQSEIDGAKLSSRRSRHECDEDDDDDSLVTATTTGSSSVKPTASTHTDDFVVYPTNVLEVATDAARKLATLAHASDAPLSQHVSTPQRQHARHGTLQRTHLPSRQRLGNMPMGPPRPLSTDTATEEPWNDVRLLLGHCGTPDPHPRVGNSSLNQTVMITDEVASNVPLNAVPHNPVRRDDDFDFATHYNELFGFLQDISFDT